MEDIECDSLVVKLSYHPNENILAGANVDGYISLWSFDSTEVTDEKVLDHPKKACRSVKFSSSGKDLYSASKDKTIQVYNLLADKVSQVIEKCHSCPPYSLEIIDEFTLASGDDDGTVKVWDLRQSKATMELKQMDEYVSSLTCSKDKRVLIGTSGEGTLTVFNIRAKRMEMQSEIFETEFLCASFVKGGQKFVVGCEDGVLNIFNNREWGNISDRFPGHPASIDCLAQINDQLICTGSMDGTIRAVSIFPNKIVGIVGEHHSPIEDMALSGDGKILASCCHDQMVKFWNVEYLHKIKTKHKKKEKKCKVQPHLQSSRKQDFFSDLQDEADSS